MKIVAVTPKENDLKRLVKLLKKIYRCDVVAFASPFDADNYIKENRVNVLFAEIEMNGMLGTALLEKARAEQESIKVILFSDSIDFAPEAFNYHAWYFFVKPFTIKNLAFGLEDTEYTCYRKYTLKEKIKKLINTISN